MKQGDEEEEYVLTLGGLAEMRNSLRNRTRSVR